LSAEPLLPYKLPKARTTLFVRRLKPLEHEDGILLGNIWGLVTHWNGKVTKPCFENSELCIGGHSEDNQRWAGYVHIYRFEGAKPQFIYLAPETAGQIFELAPPGQPLRGLCFRFMRGKGLTSCPVVQYQPHKNTDPRILPRSLDPYLSLCKFFQVSPGPKFRLAEMGRPGESGGPLQTGRLP
jgi:hypothetical protein